MFPVDTDTELYDLDEREMVRVENIWIDEDGVAQVRLVYHETERVFSITWDDIKERVDREEVCELRAKP